MAKRTPKPDDGESEMKSSTVKSCITRIEGLLGAKETARGAYMNKCGKINDQIAAVVDEGSRKGIPSKALRAAIRVRAKLQKARDELAKLEIEDADATKKILRMNDDPSDLPLFASQSTPFPITTRVVVDEPAAVH